MKLFKIFIFAALLFSWELFSLPALAAESSKACAEDIKKFCGDVKPGKGQMHHCMAQHESELSPACKAEKQEMKAKAEKFHAACKGDVDKFCKDMKPGGGRMLSCLKRNQADLSDTCREQMQQAKAAHKPRK
ncbi:MAG: hypothetical protein HY081_09825 [Gammaproteobacteria bacterium]|nr:hypothetical protein [Gammaproteobacteria bacterium]